MESLSGLADDVELKCTALVLLLVAAFAPFHSAAVAGPAADKAALPVLSFDEASSTVRISAPNVPDAKSGAWCYEDRFGKGKGELMPDGSLVLTHAYRSLTAVTRFVPEPGAIDVRLTITGDALDFQNLGGLNPCWQHDASALFGNRGLYPQDFASRCFVFTVDGLTRLENTVRYVATENPVEDNQNNPPWIQDYIPIWMPYTGQRERFHGRGTIRPVLPLVGVISRDGKWLQAWAWPKGTRLGQVWHDCLHPTPLLDDYYDPKANKLESRGRIYFMENDPEKLVRTFQADFPRWAPDELTVEPEGNTLIVASPRMPGNRIRITLPAFFDGEEMKPGSVVWSRRSWGTWTARWRGGAEGCEAGCVAWVHPYDNFLDISITAANPHQRLLTATVTAKVDYSDAPAIEAKTARAAFFWERTDRLDTDGPTLLAGGQIPGIIPGAYATSRGRFYFDRTDRLDTQAAEETVRAEWSLATPYLIAPE